MLINRGSKLLEFGGDHSKALLQEPMSRCAAESLIVEKAK